MKTAQERDIQREKNNPDNHKKSNRINYILIFICALIGICILLICGFYAYSYKNGITVSDGKMIQKYMDVEAVISKVTNDTKYMAADTDTKKEVLIHLLNKLADQKLIVPDSVVYQDDNKMIWYQWQEGLEAGIMLEAFPDGIAGYADKNKFVKDFDANGLISNLDDLNYAVDFNSASYPFHKEDVANLNLKAKYMMGCSDKDDTTSSYYEATKLYIGLSEQWNKNMLQTDMDLYCTIEDFRTGLLGYNLVFIAEHGNWNYRNKPLICTQERTPTSFTQFILQYKTNTSKYINDWKHGGIIPVRCSDDIVRWWITPDFFSTYYDKKLNDTIVWIDSCLGYHSDDLADSFLKCGAKAVLGYTESVLIAYDFCMHAGFTYSLLHGDTIGEAVQFSINLFGENDLQFYEDYVKPHKSDNNILDIIDQVNTEVSKIVNSAYVRISKNGANERLIHLTPKQIYETGTTAAAFHSEDSITASADTTHTSTASVPIITTKAAPEFSADSYYQYIRNELLPQSELAVLDTDQGVLNTKGIISAHIYDYTNDGRDDMLLITSESYAEGVKMNLKLYSVESDIITLISEYRTPRCQTNYDIYSENGFIYIHSQFISEVFGMMGWSVSEQKLSVQSGFSVVSDESGSVGAPPATDRTDDAVLLSAVNQTGMAEVFSDRLFQMNDFTDLRKHLSQETAEFTTTKAKTTAKAPASATTQTKTKAKSVQ